MLVLRASVVDKESLLLSRPYKKLFLERRDEPLHYFLSSRCCCRGQNGWGYRYIPTHAFHMSTQYSNEFEIKWNIMSVPFIIRIHKTHVTCSFQLLPLPCNLLHNHYTMENNIGLFLEEYFRATDVYMSLKPETSSVQHVERFV